MPTPLFGTDPVVRESRQIVDELIENVQVDIKPVADASTHSSCGLHAVVENQLLVERETELDHHKDEPKEERNDDRHLDKGSSPFVTPGQPR